MLRSGEITTILPQNPCFDYNFDLKFVRVYYWISASFVMEPSQFFFLILPLAIIIAVLVAVVFYLSRKTEETNYEKEIKELRRLLIKGKLDRKSFLYIRDNLKAEDHFTDESKQLDDIMKQKKMDPDTYVRTKKILEMTYNERLVKIHEKYDFDTGKI